MHSLQHKRCQGTLLIQLCTAGALSGRSRSAWSNLFLTPRKCRIFGVTCEAIPRQINFLTDEAGDCGKGANGMICRLHFFFDNHGLGEKSAFFHADNCTGQNKNNCMMHNLAGTMRLHYLFFQSGTQFSPDCGFGLLKRQYRGQE